MKFRFRLESVLVIRNHQENIEKQKLASLLSELSVMKIDYERQLTQNHKREIGKNDMQMLQPLVKAAGNHLLISSQYLRHLQMKIRQQEKTINSQRISVAEANRDVKIIENLKKKVLLEHLRELNRQEQIQQNEIATQIYMRQLRSWI